MAGLQPDARMDLATLEAAYRKLRWTIIGHAVFFFICCAATILSRRMFKLPPALLTTVFIVALLLFGGDVLRFLTYRRELRRRREAQN